MSDFSTHLLAWFDQHGRFDLPWQHNKTPYRVWLSEVMLQQTQVSTVIEYFLRFTQRFPDVQALAQAQEDDVLHLWTGLGYYNRARNLHRCAQQVVADYGGEFPASQSQLESLPGIGRSTAAAICSIAFKQAATILDGNVKRVLTRYRAIEGWPGKKAVENQLWQLATDLTPQQRNDDYTQAIMDLGATVCKRSQPRCQQCPMLDSCLAYIEDRVKQFPFSKPKKNKPVQQCYMLMLTDQYGRVFLQKRQQKGVWLGLYCFLQFEQYSELEHYAAQLSDIQVLSNPKLQVSVQFRHTFSHYHLDVSLVHIQVQTTLQLAEPAASLTPCLWLQPDNADAVGLNAVVVKQIERWQKSC